MNETTGARPLPQELRSLFFPTQLRRFPFVIRLFLFTLAVRGVLSLAVLKVSNPKLETFLVFLALVLLLVLIIYNVFAIVTPRLRNAGKPTYFAGLAMVPIVNMFLLIILIGTPPKKLAATASGFTSPKGK